MSNTGSRAAMAAITAMAMAACAVDGPDGAGPAAATDVTSAIAGGPCPDFGCGANSPVIDTQFAFHDLSLVGTSKTFPATLPNAAGLAILAAGEGVRAQIVQGGRSYDLGVVGGRFLGTCPGCTTLQGAALVGATITVTLNRVPRYLITIASVRTMSYFVGGGAVEAYTLLWKDPGVGTSTNLCNNIALLESLITQQSDDSYTRQELMGMRTFETVVFEGDRIDGNAKTMSPAFDDAWFNIGCAGHTLSKLRLTHNTVHSQATGLAQPWERRQATLKMLAADYCGGGVPLTVAGQRLVWQGDLMTYFSAPLKIEARWTEQGATCLYAPRMLYPTSSLGSSTFPNIWGSIAAACQLVGKPIPPMCTNLNPFDYAGALRVSANPKI
jgi:hypothetical protein